MLPTLLRGFGGEVVCFIGALLWICGVGVDSFWGIDREAGGGKVADGGQYGSNVPTQTGTYHRRGIAVNKARVENEAG